MKLVLAVVVLYLAIARAIPRNELESEWELYKKSHGKIYKGEEDAKRFIIFEENKKKIYEHNKKYFNGELTYRVNINQFSDMMESEVKSTMNGFKGPIKHTGVPYVGNGMKVAATLDWRNQGIVTPIKNQGQCGSCWSFSATGSLEGQHALRTGNLVSLSEQNIVDCDSSAYGCNGGRPDLAFDYIQNNGGVDTEDSYPYTAEDGTCHFNRRNIGATVTGYVDIPQGDESALMNAVANIGPISVAIDASNWSFQQYSGGVYNEPHCSTDQLDHAVLVVGYGSDNGNDYWLVKNSWGAEWGEQGYIKMTRNGDNQCGIASQASYPTV